MVLALRKYSKWTYLFFIWPFLFSYSRIYVGVHYPSDIIIGALVGLILAVIVHKGFTHYLLNPSMEKYT